MLFKFYLNNLRIAPRKVRSVISIVKGLSVIDAQNQLTFQSRRPAGPILKLLKSGVASVEKNFNAKLDNLYVQNIFVDEGPRLKRFTPRAFGRASAIHKKTSHITLILESKKAPGKKKTVAKKKETEQIAKEIREHEEMPKIIQEAPKVLGPKPTSVAKLGRRIFRRKAV